MQIKPKITLVVKGASSQLKSLSIKREGTTHYLDFNELSPVPGEEQLQMLYPTSNEGADELKRQWRIDNWGVIEHIIPLKALIYKDDCVMMNFEVQLNAPVDFITKLAAKHPDILIYLGYDDHYNPIKCGFIGFDGQIWPWKSEGMLNDMNGRAVYRDKYGDLRRSMDNELIDNQMIVINGALNPFNFVIDKLLI